MSRRREVPTLAYTVREAAEALRISENQLRIWVRDGIVRSIRWNRDVFIPRVELDRVIDAALDNGGTLPEVASPGPSRGPAAAAEGPGNGAAGGSGELTRDASAASKKQTATRSGVAVQAPA